LKHVYLDASALVKRFRRGLGSEVVNDTIEHVAVHDSRHLVVSALTTLETLSILNRRRNEAQIPLPVFILSLRGVISEIKRFSQYLIVDDHLLISSAKYTIKHNINSADAIHLAVLLALQETLRQNDGELVCMAADKRLARAARPEGITVVDPELASITQARALMQ
jgi:predicted nucleic acid-binding protein